MIYKITYIIQTNEVQESLHTKATEGAMLLADEVDGSVQESTVRVDQAGAEAGLAIVALAARQGASLVSGLLGTPGEASKEELVTLITTMGELARKALLELDPTWEG